MRVLIVAVKSSIDVYSQAIIDNLFKLNTENEMKVHNLSLEYHKPYIYRKILKKQFKKERKINYENKYNRLLSEYKMYKPDIVFFFNWLAPDYILQEMKQQETRLICWAVDTFFPDKQQYEETYPLHLNGIKYFDKIFSYNIADVSMIKNNYHVQADYLPLGYDEKIYYPQAVNKDIDISFVGARSGIRIEFLNFIAEQINKEKKDIKLAIVGIWIVNSKLNRFFKGIFFECSWC